MFFGSPEYLTFLRYKVLSLQRRYTLYREIPLLVINGTSLNIVNALLALNWWFINNEDKVEPCYKEVGYNKTL